MFCSIPAHTYLHRLTAAVGVALVLALNLLAVWPDGHAWLHPTPAKTSYPHTHAHTPSHDHAPSDGDGSRETGADDCVVVKFAQGNANCAAAPLLLSAPVLASRATLSVTPDFVAASPAHFLPPGCGPPAV
jgi:hypothetical protein